MPKKMELRQQTKPLWARPKHKTQQGDSGKIDFLDFLDVEAVMHPNSQPRDFLARFSV